MSTISAAIESGAIGRRLWIYVNYHCNLECTYCLTESGPRVRRREFPLDGLGELAREARELGFTQLGITGGEPFLLPGLPAALACAARELPTLVLSNGTLFTQRVVDQLAPLAGLGLAVQVSLDSAEPDANDQMRGPRNFERVVSAIPRLRAAGLRVRIATTGERMEAHDLERLCALHRTLGVADDDHVVRPIVRRGRAAEMAMGIDATLEDLPPELTLTADGAYWSPFGPTVRGGRPDTDLLITRTTRPLRIPAAAMARVAGASTGRAQHEPARIC